MTKDPRTGEIPIPLTGTVPILRQWDEEAKPQPTLSRGRWIFVVAAGGILIAMTFPGQTGGLSPFTDPLIDQLNIDRTAISMSYLIATLLAATALPFLGKLMDTYGARRSIMVIGATIALVLFATSFITEIIGLTASYVGLRMTGPGALTLAATTLVAKTITHRPGLALGIVGAVGAAGISLAPVGIERLVAWSDIATVWRLEAALVLLVVVPLAIALPRDNPERTSTGTLIVPPRESGHTVAQALRTPMFWVLSGAGLTLAMLATGLAFHLISILGEQGLSAAEAAANFIPQTVTALLATLGFGAIVDKIDPRWGLAASMLLLSGALVFLPFVSPGINGITFGLIVGASVGALRGVEAAAFVRFYGRGHIGAIRGVSTGLVIATSGLGPLYFALGLEWTGSYEQPSVLAAILPALVALAALFVRPPAPAATLAV